MFSIFITSIFIIHRLSILLIFYWIAIKDIIADIDFEQPEILKLYGQLDDEYKNLAIEYLKYLLFKQNKDRNSTLK